MAEEPHPRTELAHARTEAGAASPPGARALPAPGAPIGRFTVLEVLGQGGMGVVLSAYDPELDRRVAVKLVRPGGHGSTERGEVRGRLLREARAMARLSHPHVVTVHEAGTHEDQVYVAMEQIEGGTVREELARRGREGRKDWRAIVDLFLQAGRGLAAAHEAGLVHRDFKPDNLFVDRSGRVRVGDFGLVGVSGASDPDATGPGAPADTGPLGDGLTGADVVIGTPAYMPPEQHYGRAVDARSDQFAFCVSLYEALYGELPFPTESRAAYVEAVEGGEVRPAPAGSRVPAWVRDVLVRGVRADPEARFRSMDELLAQFSDQSLRRGYRLRVALMVILGAGFTALVFAMHGFGEEITFPALLASNSGALVLAGLLWLAFRRHLVRSAWNRKLFAVLGLAVGALFPLHVGAWIAGMSGAQSLLLVAMVCGAMCMVLVPTLERRMAFPGAVYFVVFFVAAARPPLALPLTASAHLVTFLTVIAVFRPARSEQRP